MDSNAQSNFTTNAAPTAAASAFDASQACWDVAPPPWSLLSVGPLGSQAKRPDIVAPSQPRNEVSLAAVLEAHYGFLLLSHLFAAVVAVAIFNAF